MSNIQGQELIGQGKTLVLPPGTFPRTVLSGDALDIELLSYSQRDSWCACVRYPDGLVRQHQTYTALQLLDQITGQLKMRYNVESFSFLAVPTTLDQPFTIKIGDIKYA